jgi:hypothetical protein
MDPNRASRGLVLIVTACLLVAACGGPAPTGSAAAETPAGQQLPITIPAPPVAATVPTGSIDDQAAALAKAVAPGGQAALAPLLAAYQAAGIPVIGEDGHPVAGSAADQVGPGWWQVWLSAGSNPQFAISLTDAATLLVAIPNAPTLDTAAVATAALADLRTMAADSDPQQHFFAKFLADLTMARSGFDLLAPGTTADDLQLSPIAIEFFMAGLTRSIAIAATTPAAAEMAPGRKVASIGEPLPIGQVQIADGAPAGNPCNPTGDAEAASYWTQWIASKIAGGAKLPGMEEAMKSAVGLVVKNASLAAKIGAAAGYLGGLIAALTYLLEMASLSVSIRIDPDPLVRTHDTHPAGGTSVVTAKLVYDIKHASLDGGDGATNCLLVFANALGIQAAMPADGAVPDAELEFHGVDGFGQGLGPADYVQFPSGASEMKQSTDQDGQAKITVQGVAQKKQVPATAIEWSREATIDIQAQPEAENARSLASMFWDSFVAAGAGPIGAVAPIFDALKTVHYDLGEYSFLVTDWQSGWVVKSTFNNNPMAGTKCDGLDGPWLIKGGTHVPPLTTSVQWTVTIAEGSTEGTFHFTENTVVSTPQGSVVSTETGQGTARVAPQKDGTVIMTVDAMTAKIEVASGGRIITSQQSFPAETFNWTPQPCDQD